MAQGNSSAMSFFGLMYFNRRFQQSTNQKAQNLKQQWTLYLLNALGFARSLQVRGLHYTLLTNDAALVQELCPNFQASGCVQPLDFVTRVPEGSRFFAAHFKLDAIEYLASQPGYSVLCDLDMLCIAELPGKSISLARQRIPMIYDITRQLTAAYGESTVKGDLQQIIGQPPEVTWFGGELLAGSADFFSALAEKNREFLPRYLQAIPHLHHVGDEALNTCSLLALQKDGVHMVDAGLTGVVARFWNYPARHPQPPLTQIANSASFLHLPADKNFLAVLAQKDLDAGQYSKEYLRYYASFRNQLRLQAYALRDRLRA